MIQALNKVLLVGCVAKPIQGKALAGAPLSMVRLQVSGIPTGDSEQLGWTHTVYVMGELAARAVALDPGTPILVEGSFFYSETPKKGEQEKFSLLRVRATRVMRVERASEDLIRDPQGGYWLRDAVNQVSLIGNVTRDALAKQRRDGSGFVLLPLALNESWRNRDGTQERRSHFVPVICAAQSAELAGIVKRGEPVLINGTLSSILRPDPLKPGVYRNTVQVVAQTLELLQSLALTNISAVPPQTLPSELAIAAD